MAEVAARFEPPSVIASRRRSMATRKSPVGAPAAIGRARSDRARQRDAHGGGEPILELGIEAVLRLAGLQIEEAEH